MSYEKSNCGRGLVFNFEDQLLLIFRHGKWDLPKGHFEKGETLESCAIREVKEETGLKEVTITSFIGVTEHTYFDNKLNSDAIKEVHWYVMRAAQRSGLFPQLQEGIEWLRWVSRGELSGYLKNSYDNIREIVGKAIPK
ncbi:NUDIX hydrolase [Puia sp. P3]|uniref:NUDIX hydrolase n=1 Tax=Puia sp. P3 TaxID=3423952 RepID=UPI003D679CC2